MKLNRESLSYFSQEKMNELIPHISLTIACEHAHLTAEARDIQTFFANLRQTPSRRIALFFAAYARDSKVSLFTG